MLKEIHLHLDVRQKDLKKEYIIFNNYIHAKKEINKALNDEEDDYIIHTTQPHFLSFNYLPARLFVHVYNEFHDEEIHEITVGRCKGTKKELRPAHNLERMLLAGAFDWFKE